MYQTDDVENEITIKDCFKNLVELAWETRALDVDLANKFFDILVECLGVDFRLTFEVDKELVSGNMANLILNNFRTLNGCVSFIDQIFNNFDYLVHEGKFSPEYREYLQQRRDILLELISYQNNKVTKVDDILEAAKLDVLNHDIKLLDARISLVSENLDTRRR